MHELSVTQSILDIALRHAAKEDAAYVTDLYLVIGQLSSFVDDSVQFYWEIVSQETICAGAKLHFERIPAKFYCLDCEYTFTLPGELAPCPHCEGIQVKLLAGDEFYLQSIEVEEKSTPLYPLPPAPLQKGD
ncbi:MAG: hydrogenase maturation nickel metallochaperone HypA [Chloroflexi bacterium]|nr:hydrogenase maturation nickel metallochaperone HypA [Chloroflexota bacterium]